jgi:CRP/FNR family transcriptional regulator
MNIVPQVVHRLETARPADKKAAARAGCSACSLRKICISGTLDESEINHFETLVSGKRRVARHAGLLRKHETLDKLYVVRSGQFKLTLEDAAGQRRVAEFYLPGDVMGLDAIANGQHNYELVALEGSEVCEIPFDRIVSMMSVEPAIQRQFMKIMSVSLNDAFNRSFLLAASLEERFSGFLLRLAEKYGRLGYSSKSFRLGMPRGDIGSYLGTSVESVSRLVARFNAHGAVAINGRMVELLDWAYLHAVTSRDDQVLQRAA